MVLGKVVTGSLSSNLHSCYTSDFVIRRISPAAMNSFHVSGEYGLHDVVLNLENNLGHILKLRR